MANGLRTLGVPVEEYADGLSITGAALTGGRIDSATDHRIAMAFSIAAWRATEEIQITDCKNVATSFPNFVEIARSAGLNLDVG